MKIPVVQQIQRSDFPEAPNWISKLLYPLQFFMTTVVTALTNQLTYQDNFSCIVNTRSFVAAATANANVIQFLWPYTRQPVELTMRATRTDGVYDSIYPVPSWNLVGDSIVINGIQGLTPAVSYNLTFVVK